MTSSQAPDCFSYEQQHMREGDGHEQDYLPVDPENNLSSRHKIRWSTDARSISEKSQPSNCSTGTFQQPGKDKYFKSRWVEDKGAIEKPWLSEKRSPREKFVNFIPLIGFLAGLVGAGWLIYDGYSGVSRNKYCPVMIDDFSMGRLDDSKWMVDVGVGGQGVGQFDQTTNSDENIYVSNGTLYLRPTLQDTVLVENDNIVDLRGQGCTYSDWTDCVATTNTTNGTIINPVKSARINTRPLGNIKYGRVEVLARLPQGDWLWPSIILMPTNNVYGQWPMSGQIDLVQSRGNNYTYDQGGNNVIASTLHFGPNEELDGWWRNNVKSMAYHDTFSDRFHKFGVEWTEKYIFTYIDTRLLQVAYTHFKKPFWEYGQFPSADRNGTRFINPWEYGTRAAPFDQDFHLVLRVGAGATNGWFEDNKSGKPWLDRDVNAKLRFWQARDQWYPTWARHGYMEVKSVKMWQQAPHNGCKLSEASRFVG